MLSQITVKQRLLLLVVLSLITSLVIGGIGVFSLYQNNKHLEEVYLDATLPLKQLTAIMEEIMESRIIITPTVLSKDPAKAQKALVYFKEVDVKVSNMIKQYRETDEKTNQKLIEQFENSWSTYSKIRTDNMIFAAQGDFSKAEEGQNNMDSPGKKSLTQLRETWKELFEMQVKESQEAFQNSKTSFKTSMFVMGGVITVGSFLIIGLGSAITVNIRRPLRHLTEILKKAGNGDFSARSQLTNKDEITGIGKDLNSTLNQVSQSVKQAVESSDMVIRRVDDLVREINNIYKSSQEQFQASSHMASSVEQIISSISEVASHAEETKVLSSKSTELAHNGSNIVRNASTEISKVAQIITDSSQQINMLSESSRQINNIVNVIREIAEQTNLLALNAAIEAARAGESGKGFAVVADEVRKLAERTAGATVQITTLITSIQNEVDTTVSKMESCNQQATQSVSLAQEAGSALSEISQGTTFTANKVTEISVATNEQNSAGQHIAQSVAQIADMAEQNTRSVQQISMSADELRNVANQLKESMGRFKF